MYFWLRCSVTPGQFSNEYGVTGYQVDGKVFSLFSPKEFVKCDHPPQNEERVDGLVRVRIYSREGDQVIVQLPQESFERGHYVTVSADQVQTAAQEHLVA